MDQPITFRYLDIDEIYQDAPLHAPYLASPELKDRALNKLHIPRHDDRTPLQDWILQMAVENNLPATLPQPEIGDAALTDPAIAKFVWFLA